MIGCRIPILINTGLQPGVSQPNEAQPFQRLLRARKTVETVKAL